MMLEMCDVFEINEYLSAYGFSQDEIAKINFALRDILTDKLPYKEENKGIHTINHSKDESSGVDYSIKADSGKYCPTLCHPSLIEAVARVRMFGAGRYGGTETWKRVEEQRYKDALYRHLLAYLENPDGVDEESGLPHLYHVACNVDFLVELHKERMKNGKFNRK